MSEDRRLVRALHRGENAAWRRIYLKYKDDLLTVAQSLVHDVNTAEDCLQEVFVLLAADGCKVRSNLKGYLLNCIANRARDHLRRRDAQSDCQVNMRMQSVDSADPADALAEDDRAKIVTQALEELPIDQRRRFIGDSGGPFEFITSYLAS
jgi:RNA polymerase sigma factor (sigma-70 family)